MQVIFSLPSRALTTGWCMPSSLFLTPPLVHQQIGRIWQIQYICNDAKSSIGPNKKSKYIGEPSKPYIMPNQENNIHTTDSHNTPKNRCFHLSILMLSNSPVSTIVDCSVSLIAALINAVAFGHTIGNLTP